MNKFFDRFKKNGKNEIVANSKGELIQEFKIINNLNHFFAKLEFDINKLELNNQKIHLPKILAEYTALFEYFLKDDLEQFVSILIKRLKVSLKSISKDEKLEGLISAFQTNLLTLQKSIESESEESNKIQESDESEFTEEPEESENVSEESTTVVIKPVASNKTSSKNMGKDKQ